MHVLARVLVRLDETFRRSNVRTAIVTVHFPVYAVMIRGGHEVGRLRLLRYGTRGALEGIFALRVKRAPLGRRLAVRVH